VKRKDLFLRRIFAKVLLAWTSKAQFFFYSIFNRKILVKIEKYGFFTIKLRKE